MKKLFAIIMAVVMIASVSTVAFATESTTTLTTTVPAATYTLNIPANQEIPFGTTEADIGNITVTDSSGFAVGKNLEVTITYDAFGADGISTKIPYNIKLIGDVISAEMDDEINIVSGDKIRFLGRSSGVVSNCPVSSTNVEYLTASLIFKASSADWGKALAGEYFSNIVFTAEVVAEE